MNDSKDDSPQEKPGGEKPGAPQIIFSTVAAAFGVQSNKNRERDFSRGSLTTYIISGITFTVLFVLVVLFVVRLVLSGH